MHANPHEQLSLRAARYLKNLHVPGNANDDDLCNELISKGYITEDYQLTRLGTTAREHMHSIDSQIYPEAWKNPLRPLALEQQAAIYQEAKSIWPAFQDIMHDMGLPATKRMYEMYKASAFGDPVEWGEFYIKRAGWMNPDTNGHRIKKPGERSYSTDSTAWGSRIILQELQATLKKIRDTEGWQGLENYLASAEQDYNNGLISRHHYRSIILLGEKLLRRGNPQQMWLPTIIGVLSLVILKAIQR